MPDLPMPKMNHKFFISSKSKLFEMAVALFCAVVMIFTALSIFAIFIIKLFHITAMG